MPRQSGGDSSTQRGALSCDFVLREREASDEPGRLLDAEHANLDAWFHLDGRLKRRCWQLGSATLSVLWS